jgi:DNA-binding XRE family transcriptional regulator
MTGQSAAQRACDAGRLPSGWTPLTTCGKSRLKDPDSGCQQYAELDSSGRVLLKDSLDVLVDDLEGPRILKLREADWIVLGPWVARIVVCHLDGTGDLVGIWHPNPDNAAGVVRTPTELNTVGDHIRRRRLALKLLQKDVADQAGVGETSVFKWAANTSQPDLKYMPAVIQFLGYNLLPPAKSWGERLVRQRTSLRHRPCAPSPGRQAAAWGPHRN